ncbi:signal peptidase I [Streptomyces sp. NPDC060011]|uniref:signal peptidase I n=1 Tax=unclassified Streptomyces TaxID=2593676 RepID=UPI0013BC58B3|nr:MULTISPECIES: signal peptidase I [unclassified Streptomyces]MCX4917318.1 signal peptidase I [Streptomyces sp. NBC_00687]MCX5130579.1 signal peptidase I [Streptomyces sp. NBC_00340]MCX5279397.1 signal peptidase I [Streptomyces sp. NBC_00198]NEB34047.1 signal peptidase I [Streptomyces sp. SID14446]WSD77305.1 signal peptidase I [Streptomyces sp. NBC_01558]
MGNRGRPRGAPTSAMENLLPTGTRRASGGAARPSRVERRKLARKIKRRRRRSAAKEIPLLVGVAVLIALVLKTFLVQAFVIPSGSMENTIQIGDRVLVDKFTPWFGSEPSRGDVVVFKDPGGWLTAEETKKKDDPVVVKQFKQGLTFIGLLPSDNEKDLIKRVVGVGGDTVKCCDAQGRVTVNGTPLTEPYIFAGDKPSDFAFEVKVPEGRLFVLGDHRGNSADSRYHRTDKFSGTVSEKSIVGRAMIIGWPIGHWTRLREPSTFSTVADAPGASTAASALSHRVAPADPDGLIPLPSPAELPLVMGVVGLRRIRRGRRHGVRSGCGGCGGRRTVRTRWSRRAAGAARRCGCPRRGGRVGFGQWFRGR